MLFRSLPQEVDSWPQLPPIGKAITNTHLYVLDQFGNPQPTGLSGELYIHGDCLALGYLGEMELTNAKFIDDPITGGKMYATGDIACVTLDGSIAYLGRKDRQYKVAGYRIEAAEIEAALLTIPQVLEALVNIQTDAGGFNRIHAYIVSSDKTQEAQFKQQLSERLPQYMVPSRIHFLAQLPLTSSGKLDVNSLNSEQSTAPTNSLTSQQKPTSAIEVALHAMWSTLLERDTISLNTDFFMLGGHSLLLISLWTQVKQQLCPTLSLNELYQHTTIATLADCITRKNQTEQPSESRQLIHLLSDTAPTDKPKLFCLPPIFGLGSAYSNLANFIDAYTVYGIDYATTSAANAFTYYAEQIQQIQPLGPITLLGYSAGGTLAYQLALYLEKSGREVANIIVIDALPLEAFKQQLAQHYQPESTGKTEQNQTFINSLVDQYAGSLNRDKGNKTVEFTLSSMADNIKAYLNDLLTIEPVKSATTSANIHLIYTTADVEHADWEQLTLGLCQRYLGAGKHMDMLFAEHGKQNALQINQLLENTLFNNTVNTN